jgi:cytochrome c-type biogenesis protein CcsB
MAVYKILFGLSFLGYFSGGFAFLAFFLTQRRFFGQLGLAASLAGFLFHTAVLCIRASILGYPPVSSLYESLSFFAWVIMLVYIFTESRVRSWVNGAFIVPLAVMLMGYALSLDSRVRPLSPALQSPWLGIHVTACFLGYACFLLAFCFALMYLWQEAEVKSKRIDAFFFRLPSLGLVDRLGYTCVGSGFVFLSAGIITGSLWASRAWGSYWSWDPKEVWSLIVWFIYLMYLHGRFLLRWRGRRLALISILGFASVLFTYFGASVLVPGLHAYF